MQSKKQAKACVIGHFGQGKKLLNGQTVKTLNVTQELQKHLGRDGVLTMDTHGGWKIFFKAPIQVLQGLKGSENVLIFPARKGLRVYGPLLALLRPFFRNRKLHYVVIGGWLNGFLEGKPFLRRCLKRFDGIYVETKTMKTQLEGRGFNNVCVMPNFKDLTPVSQWELVYTTEEPYRVCTFSRVMREKGIEEAVEAVKAVNARCGRTVYTLDIYGQVDAGQTDWFEALEKSFPPEVRYGGMVPYDQSVGMLKDYFALLFPTFYQGEGFAGTVIDAFSAGVPVVASDWLYNGELIHEAENGALVPPQNAEALADKLMELSRDVAGWNSRKVTCLEHARRYSPEIAMTPLLERIG